MIQSLAKRMRYGRLRFEPQFVLYCSLLIVVAALVAVPTLIIIINSFSVGGMGRPSSWGLDGWRLALSDPTMLGSIWNSVRLLLAIQVISLPVSIAIAWLLGRTDLPGRGTFEFMFWVAFFVPSLSVTLGWIMLLDPQSGIVNRILMSLPFIDGPIFNIYSFWGVVWTHLATSSISVKVMLLTPAFRNIDSSHEEVARICGATKLQTLFRVVIPLIFPAILIVVVLATIRAMQNFEIELVLGPPFRFYVYGTKIYTMIAQEPPQFGGATALATMGLLIIAPLILMQRWLIGRKDYTSVTGRIRLSPTKLGVWRWLAFTVVFILVLVLTVIPIAFLIIASFMKLFGFFAINPPFTTDHWHAVIRGEEFTAAIVSTLKMAIGAAAGAIVLCSLVAYFTVRSRYPGRSLLDFLSWLPFALPGILLGLGLLNVFLGIPMLRFLYGSITLLVIATVIGSMTLGTQILKTNLIQLGHDLEEAARTAGANWWTTFRAIVAPILIPTLILVGVLNFISAARDISSVALLASHDTRTLSLLQLDYMVEGRWEAAAVISVIVVALTTGIAFLARFLGLKLGIKV
jgi:iron(III) transport system permease protein